MRLADKVVPLTGRSRGLGREATLLFAREGARVAVTARGQEGLDAVVADAADEGLKLLAIRGDVSSEDDCRRMVDTAIAERRAHRRALRQRRGCSRWAPPGRPPPWTSTAPWR